MPVENEFCYLAHDPRSELERALSRRDGCRRFEMRQGYLNDDTRLRAFHEVATGEVTYVFSFKRKVGGESIEIETPMSAEDFRKLYKECAITLRKTRFAFEEGGIHWDVDFLRDRKGKAYFVKAEAEVDEKVVEPPAPAGILEPYILAIPGKAKGFSSRRLADEGYARQIMETLNQAQRKEGRRQQRGMRMAA